MRTNAQILLGIGSGRCGTLSLARLLDAQTGSSVSHERRPLLPWVDEPGHDVVRRRLARLKRGGATIVGDVASFYLPYLDSLLEVEPDARVVCLRREREAVVESFCRWLDRIHSVPTDHWSQTPASGWHHHPVWSVMFPKYDTTIREDGIRRYWDDYYQRVDELIAKYSDNIRLFETGDALNTESGVRSILDFVGIPRDEQVIEVGMRAHQSDQQPQRRRQPRSESLKVPGADRCVILVPCGASIAPGCDDSLRELERRGYTVRRVRGFSQIDVGRSQMATDALIDGFEETLWIDSDVGFHPDAVEKLRRHNLPIVCGIYAKKGQRALACHVPPGTKQMKFGKSGGLYELTYAATGFLHVRRQVYQDVQEKLNLPLCNETFGKDLVPFFLPMVRELDEGHWYLGEDYAFCERTRQAGYQIWADTTIRLWHHGNYAYGWEDAGRDPQRFGDYGYNF